MSLLKLHLNWGGSSPDGRTHVMSQLISVVPLTSFVSDRKKGLVLTKTHYKSLINVLMRLGEDHWTASIHVSNTYIGYKNLINCRTVHFYQTGRIIFQESAVAICIKVSSALQGAVVWIAVLPSTKHKPYQQQSAENYYRNVWPLQNNYEHVFVKMIPSYLLHT